MIFLPNQLQKEKSNLHQQHYNQQARNQNQGPQTQQQLQQKRNQQIKQREQRELLKKQKSTDVIVSVLAIFGSMFAIGGVALLVYGIIVKQSYGYIAGPILIGVSVLFFAIMGYLLCKSSKQQTKSKVRASPATMQMQNQFQQSHI